MEKKQKTFSILVYPQPYEYEKIPADTEAEAEDIVMRAQHINSEEVYKIKVVPDCEECGITDLHGSNEVEKSTIDGRYLCVECMDEQELSGNK